MLFFSTVLCIIIKMMDGLGPNLYFSACQVSMFKTCTCEFTKKYQYSPNNLITDFMNLKKSNVSIYKL